MRSLIIAHETRSLVRSKWLAWVLGLIVVGIAFAIWAGSNTIEAQRNGAVSAAAFDQAFIDKFRSEVVEYAQKVEENGWEYEFAPIRHSPGGKAPQGTNAGAVGAETNTYAVLPPTGLAAFSIGQSDILLSYIPVNLRNIFDASRAMELANPVNLQTGSFDVAFVVIFLLPIFILAMTYDLLSSEKERGTLAMIMAHPVSLRDLMASKLISRARILLSVVAVLGFAALLAVGDNLGAVDTWARFAVWMGATVLYGLFWFALAVFVNAMGKTSATNGIILASAWLVFVVIIPTLVSIVATTTYPAPSRMDLTTAAREAQTAAEKGRLKALDEYYYDHAEYVPEEKARDFLTISLANSDAIQKEVTPIYQEFQDQLNRQEGLVGNFQYVSPAIMMQLALNEISGTSADRYEHFMDQVFAFHDEYKKFYNSRFVIQKPMTPEDYELLPEFQYQEEAISTVYGRLAPSFLGLLIVVIGVTAIAFSSLRRYQVAGR